MPSSPPPGIDPVEFSSPFADHVGWRIGKWREGFAAIDCVIAPHHLNRQGVVHGGLLLALLDDAGGAAGTWSATADSARKSVTVDLDCRFITPGRGDLLRVEAHVVGHGRSIYFARSEVRDVNGALVAIGASTHRWRRTA